MFGFTVRRILGAVPSLLLFTIALFVAISLAPPTGLGTDEVDRRFWHLPMVFNLAPEDRPRNVARLLGELAEATGEVREQDLRRLLRIGAAGLPDIVAGLERLEPRARVRLSRELAPLAFRMGLDDVQALEDDQRVGNYFRRVLDDRAADLRPSSVRRALQRHLADRNEPLYARQLRNADTAVLAPIFEELPATEGETREVLEALAIAALQRADARVRDAAGLHAYWAIHRSEYVEFGALERTAARLTETRFGRWIVQALTARFGRSWRTGVPVLEDLKAKAPLTLARASFGLLLAYLLAAPISVWTAARRAGALDRGLSWLLLLLHALPPFIVALVARSLAPRLARTDAFVAVALALVALAPMARFMRSRLLEEAGSDRVRTSRAMGLPSFAIWVRDIGRNALGSIIALGAIEAPALISATILAEEILSLDGLGPAVISAVRARDVPWLMAFGLLAALFGAVILLVSDLLQARNDPRVRRSLLAVPEDA